MQRINRFFLTNNFLLLLAIFFIFLPSSANAEIEELRRTPVVKAVQKTSPAVVNIQASKVVERQISPFRSFFGQDPFFEDFFPSRKKEYVQRSLGSGVIINGEKRLVLTNAHVITGASDIKVKLLDGRSFEAELVGSDPDFDLAVLRLSGKGNLPQARQGTSDDLLIGEPVIAIGNPYGFSHTVSTGVISALDRTIETKHGTYMGFIQTDAPINPGNSGGPLLNILGELIGINTAIYAKAQGIGFAIPVNKAKRVVDELLSYGQVQPVWLGILGQDVDQRMASYFNLKSAKGLLVTEVFKATPAAEAGIKAGNLILKMDEIEVQDKDHYLRLLKNVTQDQTLSLELFDEGNKRKLRINPAKFTQDMALQMAKRRWGIVVAKNNKQNRMLIKDVLENSPAKELGLKPGDEIYKVAGQAVNSLEDFVQAFMRYRLQNSLILLVARGNKGYYVRLRL